MAETMTRAKLLEALRYPCDHVRRTCREIGCEAPTMRAAANEIERLVALVDAAYREGFQDGAHTYAIIVRDLDIEAESGWLESASRRVAVLPEDDASNQEGKDE